MLYIAVFLRLFHLAALSDNRRPPRSKVLLEKLIVTQLEKKSLEFYGTRRFITVFTRTYNWSLSWARCIQSTNSHPISI